MTASEAYQLVTHGGATDFAGVLDVCESLIRYCLVGDLAVNCYVEPVYTLDADLVLVAQRLPELVSRLEQNAFRVTRHAHSINADSAKSDLRIQFTTDERYQEFVKRAEIREVLGVSARVASLRDVTQGKLWAFSDPNRRLSKRKKDELDLIRLAEAYPELRASFPKVLLDQLDATTLPPNLRSSTDEPGSA